MPRYENYRPLLEKTLNHAIAHLENLESESVVATASLTELRERLAYPLSDGRLAPEKIIEDLVADTAGGFTGNAGGRFFAWVIGGVTPASLAADWLTSTWDQNAALYICSPVAAVVEEICGAWLKDLLRLPSTASFALVTGCQMAHVTCLNAARYFLLQKFDWNVGRKGLAGAPQIRVLTSQRHGSFERAVRLLGIGTDNIIGLTTDEGTHLKPEILQKALKEHSGSPLILCLQAGEINTGAFDPFKELIPLAHKYNAWVHVDGAFGLWAAASPQYRHFLEGVEAADSWATDGHKWLNVPYDSGYAFVAHPDAHRNSMSHLASYFTLDKEARDEMDWNPEWSRRARGFATYAAIRELGRNGIADLVERTCRHAHALVTQIGALNGAEMMWEPIINQGLVRFLNPKPNAAEADHNQYTDQVIAEILKTGEAFFGGTTWRGKRCMRVSVCNWQTSDADVQRTVEAIRKVLKRN